MLHFNYLGFLEPNKQIICELSTFEQYFVNEFESKTRKQIFGNFKTFYDEIKRITNANYLVQWINGSFVTKKNNPKDIDFVTFIEESVFLKHQAEINDFLNQNNWYALGIDAYFVIVRTEGTKYFFRYESDKMYWFHQFTKVKSVSKRDKTRKKGFVELNY